MKKALVGSVLLLAFAGGILFFLLKPENRVAPPSESPSTPAAKGSKAPADLPNEAEILKRAEEQADNPEVQRQLGLYYQAQNRVPDAEKYLGRALKLRPDSPESFRDLIFLYLDNNQTDKAFQMLNEIPDAQKKAFHYEILGVVDTRAGKLEDAETHFKKALEMAPNESSTEMLLFEHYLRNKRPDGALKLLDDRLKRNPADATAMAMKGALAEQTGKREEAEKLYRQALQADSNQDLASNNLAFLLAEDGRDLDAALNLAQSLRNRLPGDPNAADTLAWVHYKRGNINLAKLSAEAAVAKQPDNPQFQYHYGVILKAGLNNSQAETALKTAIASKKEFAEREKAVALLKELGR